MQRIAGFLRSLEEIGKRIASQNPRKNHLRKIVIPTVIPRLDRKKSQKSSLKKNSRPIELQESDKIVRIHDRTIRKRKVPLETPEVVNYSYESTPTPLSRQETQIVASTTAIVATQKSKSVADARISYSVPFTKGYSANPMILN